MRFHVGAIPATPDFSPDESWKPLREPTPWIMQLIACPIGFGVAGAVAALWFTLTPLEFPTEVLSVTEFLLSFAALIVVHELIHAAVHPKAGRSPQSILGIWPSRLLFYAHYDGEMTRNRFIAIFLMPLLVISLVPLLIAAVTQLTAGWAAYLSTLNALSACGDILGAGIVMSQVPASATVRNQGWRTYWREGNSSAV